MLKQRKIGSLPKYFCYYLFCCIFGCLSMVLLCSYFYFITLLLHRLHVCIFECLHFSCPSLDNIPICILQRAKRCSRNECRKLLTEDHHFLMFLFQFPFADAKIPHYFLMFFLLLNFVYMCVENQDTKIYGRFWCFCMRPGAISVSGGRAVMLE